MKDNEISRESFDRIGRGTVSYLASMKTLDGNYSKLLTDIMARFLFTKRLHSTVVIETVESLTTQSVLLDHCLPTAKEK